MTTRKRIMVSLTPEMEEAVEDYRHKHRLSATSTAIERLIEIGIMALKDETRDVRIDVDSILSHIIEAERLLNEGTG